jgi:Cd2+/Zn2+-exporting ATPase
MTTLNVDINDEKVAEITLADVVKDEAKNTIEKLKSIGIKKTIMLTGDKKEVGEKVAKKVLVDDFYTDLLPIDKVEKIEKYKHIIFVGDGINDAPVLVTANVGIAMGKIGSDIAIESADVVIMSDDLQKIPKAIEIARKTMSIAKQNIVFAISIKLLFLILGFLGITSIWMAIFADVGVCLLVILNSMRIMTI